MRDRRCESDRWRILIKREAHLEAVFTPTASAQEGQRVKARERARERGRATRMCLGQIDEPLELVSPHKL